jgi:hypothetical protein
MATKPWTPTELQGYFDALAECDVLIGLIELAKQRTATNVDLEDYHRGYRVGERNPHPTP